MSIGRVPFEKRYAINYSCTIHYTLSRSASQRVTLRSWVNTRIEYASFTVH